VAIAAAPSRRLEVAASTTSVFAELRRSHRHLAPQRLRKATLLSRSNWKELARTARSATAFADFGASSRDGRLALVHLPEEAPMRREWSLVCDADDHTAVMAAWELPGQDRVPDRDRAFECIWSLEPRAVRDAARVCAQLEAVLTGSPDDPSESEAPAPEASDDLRDATTMFERLVFYVDRHPR
jgi:MerR family transcriptional regulator, light-induced transcriptional regulator